MIKLYIPLKTNVNGCIENRILILYGLEIHCIPISNFQPVFFFITFREQLALIRWWTAWR